jgi:hypothetical protein
MTDRSPSGTIQRGLLVSLAATGIGCRKSRWNYANPSALPHVSCVDNLRRDREPANHFGPRYYEVFRRGFYRTVWL